MIPTPLPRVAHGLYTASMPASSVLGGIEVDCSQWYSSIDTAFVLDAHTANGAPAGFFFRTTAPIGAKFNVVPMRSVGGSLSEVNVGTNLTGITVRLAVLGTEVV